MYGGGPMRPSGPSSGAAGGGTTSRREFLTLAAAVGLLGPAGVGCLGTPDPADDPPDPAPGPAPAGSDHLARGLMAMSTVHLRGWVPGHHGAAVIASHYFREDNHLDERTARALRANVEAFMARSPGEFPAPDPGRGTADPARIVERLDGQVAELRSGGHDKIFASLALRALRDLPEFATPSVIDGVCRLLEVFAETARPVAPSRYALEHPMPPYRGPEDVASVTLAATLRPWSHLRGVGTSGVLHWVTHAEALVTLEELGYGDVARRGHGAQQRQFHRPVEDDRSEAPERPAIDWLGPGYWESEAPRRLLDGSWLFGHSFKLPYSLFRLLRRVDDPAFRAACVARAAELTIPFE